MIKTLKMNVSGTKRAVAPKQRPDGFRSNGDQYIFFIYQLYVRNMKVKK